MKNVPYKRRVIAYIIDIILAYVGAIVLVKLARLEMHFRLRYFTRVSLIAGGILFVYLFLTYWIFGGVSLGRLFTNLRIVKNNKAKSRMKFADCFIRALMQAVIVLAPFNIGYQLFHKSSASIYDYVTDTKSVYIDPKKEHE